MSFVFDANIDEFFTEIQSAKGKFKVNRSKVRLLAEKYHEYIKSIESSGGNKHAAELDVHDATVDILTKIMTSNHAELATDFSNILTEEKLALTNYDFDKSEKERHEKLKEIEKEASKKPDILRALPWIAALFVVLLLLGFSR